MKDLKEIRDFIADDNPDKAAETIDNIYKTFENVVVQNSSHRGK